MDYTEARQAMVENLSKQPQEFELQLERLFENPHFGNVVTEVFPAILNPHDRDGRALMKKYAAVAGFLQDTHDVDDAVLVALRIETENIEYGQRNPRQGVKAMALRYYEGLRAEHFEVARDESGQAVGLAIAHPAFTYTEGWKDEPRIVNTVPFAVVDSTAGNHWRSVPSTEQESSAQYIFGANTDQIDAKARQLDEAYRFISSPIWGVVLEMEQDAIYRKAGKEPKVFSPLATEAGE